MSLDERSPTFKELAPPSRELRDLARDVRRIGDARRTDPETICIQKDDIAHRLLKLARRLEHPPA